MLSPNPQQCHECTGAINRENHTVVRLIDRTVEWMVCNFCHIGWLLETHSNGEVYALAFQQRLDPKYFAKFVKELEDARAA